MHHIQRSILDQLASFESARYSQINSSHLDGNIFIYHLRQLIAANYICKNSDGSYSLTQKGKTYIVNRFENPQLQAHSVLLLVIKDQHQGYLMRRRMVQPHLDYVGFVHGEPQADETIITTVKKRLHTKTNLNAKSIEIFSSGLVKMTSQALESYSNCIVITIEPEKGKLLTEDLTGQNYWLKRSELSNFKLLPSTLAILERIDKDDRSFFELSYQLGIDSITLE